MSPSFVNADLIAAGLSPFNNGVRRMFLRSFPYSVHFERVRLVGYDLCIDNWRKT